MEDIVILLAIKKIGIALAKVATHQASAKFAKYGTQLLELQGSMDRHVRELRVMHDVLCQSAIRNPNDAIYESWLEGVRKVAHNMEDMVDEYLHLVGHAHDIGCCFYLKKGLKKPRSLLALKCIAFTLKEIEKDLSHLSETRRHWVPLINSGDYSNSNHILKRSQDLANISRSLDEEDLVGVDENREKLQKLLASDILERSVIALLGMGGLGKTALAANVYRKEMKNFQCHAWVSISQTYSKEDVLRNIIKELSGDKVNTVDMEITCVEETLKKFLKKRKYLIILDDVWTPEAFTYLSGVLIHNDKGSRLLITTREKCVAELASSGHTLTVQALPDDKALDLFCKKAFPSSGSPSNKAREGLPGYFDRIGDTYHEFPAELKPLAVDIVSKCKSLPLLIVLVGGLFRVCDKTVKGWNKMKAQLSWELINNSSLDHIRNVLHLSFIYLPTHLKSCFLYCSLFPEDYIFRRKQLVRLWIAEGFIEERGESTVEEVAEGYLNELIDRSMLQLVDRNIDGRIKKIRMHDILRELAVDLCKKNCFGATYENKRGQSLETDVRRLVVHKLKEDIHQSFLSIHRLRTVITLDNSMPSSTLLPVLCKKSRYMTVLELSGLPIEKIPDAIGDLFNLRYLGLRNSKVKMLPKSVKKLSNLLTLDLFGCDIPELPRGIMKLKKLKHLFAEKIIDPHWRELACCSGIRIPNGFGNLTNLQTLQALEACEDSVRYLRELTQLRRLRLWNVKGINFEPILDSLAQMQYLSFLEVNASDVDEVLSFNAPLPMPNLQKLHLGGGLAAGALDELFKGDMEKTLYSLILRWSKLTEDPLLSLSRLSNLQYLNFSGAYNGKKLRFRERWFPKLKVLYLGDLPRLSQLKIDQGTMVCLEKLYLTNLKRMMEVPTGIQFLSTLQYLEFGEITADFLVLLQRFPAIKDKCWQHTLRV
ncbi:disease resistance protein RPM1 [Aegilops tauschii subsp. strangulata]|uniref:Disease resistance protein RPM1 n=1 Tax=Aegilops tauschii subsp. strangulata TaxID=200361 RepID=A0A453QG74_AEGTS|nr:disease resistance protein RPM1 [Aegilops tauschii subsp. strangulata]XP_040250768.1 disease resistance protein RPM1 [Aegilops tauschii subsp. strangulata]